jgi:hypothetical protein
MELLLLQSGVDDVVDVEDVADVVDVDGADGGHVVGGDRWR